jgi:hypothetical protein
MIEVILALVFNNILVFFMVIRLMRTKNEENAILHEIIRQGRMENNQLKSENLALRNLVESRSMESLYE